MAGLRRLKAIRAIVRPDKRGEYLSRWRGYASAARALGAQVWLFEDQGLPGRFLEFTEYEAARDLGGELARAAREAELGRSCVRRDGDEILYREVSVDG